MRLHIGYALLTVALLAIELAIALFVRDAIVRPYVGDALAVVLVYAGLRAVTTLRVVPAVLVAFGIAVVIECSQYLRLLDHVGLGGNRWARMILGSGFDLVDFVAYAGGAILVLLVERYRRASRAAGGTRTVSPSSESSSTI
ncbi:DUF2809 domain-containing protein [Sphingomonas sp. 2R-10]|uniref:ribosomal maturation YjgA family protein n=1 Tax=Sphingomonas sp. 2R-10 TaxID=3045148 RepID=UPI000F7790CC|nr:DUF2809 domain-containing protein [Sphingomonas sp. 2R-10]MDJ0277890.1 DUF2809 domain-containing protein [Sphingomonas sp. 2R-10]